MRANLNTFLKERAGPGTVTTLDALLTQRRLAEQIVAEGREAIT